jgi:hypothetical protein
VAGAPRTIKTAWAELLQPAKRLLDVLVDYLNGFAKPRQGVVANVLNFSRNGTVGFIDWLDLFCKNRIIVPK